jgi:hypothetical protein
MMTSKGEIGRRQIQRRWPHRVELPAEAVRGAENSAAAQTPQSVQTTQACSSAGRARQELTLEGRGGDSKSASVYVQRGAGQEKEVQTPSSFRKSASEFVRTTYNKINDL